MAEKQAKLNFKHILAVFFAGVMIFVFITSDSLGLMLGLLRSLSFNTKSTDPAAEDATGTDVTASVEPVDIGNADSKLLDDIAGKNELVDFAGDFQKTLGIKDYYAADGIYITDSGVIEAAYPETSLEYELSHTLELGDFLKANGINFMYVNQPTKYIDDSEFEREFGVKTFCNRNADRFVKGLRDAGVPVLDLRESLVSQGMNVKDMFYRTDHHWTVPTGLWAAGEIANALNENFGYDIDPEYYNPDNFVKEEYPEVWLGEQGKKVSLSYVGLDDYICMYPEYETSYTFPGDWDDYFEGDFSYFVQRSIMNTEVDVYEAYSWHYGYARCDVTNNLVESGNVLLICDSYEQTVEPFLSLGLNKTASVIMRDMGEDFDIRQYILDGGYDTVVITYAQTWFGAHDDPENINSVMFDF